jgi:hypothetical protein
MAIAPTLNKTEATAETAASPERRKFFASSFVVLAIVFFIALDVAARLTFNNN